MNDEKTIMQIERRDDPGFGAGDRATGTASPWKRGLLARTAWVGLVGLLAGCQQDATSPTEEPVGVPSAVSADRAEAPGRIARLIRLGEAIFFDEDLSINRNQACGSCHDPEWGFSGPLEEFNAAGSVNPGSFADRFGNRKPPSSAYATPSPILALDGTRFVGGNFWDGRATGQLLGDPAADQALAPFVNSVEQALRDPACVVYRVSRARYGGLFVSLFGPQIRRIEYPYDIEAVCAEDGEPFDLEPMTRDQVTEAYQNVARAIAAFESSSRVNQFSSKFDAWKAGSTELTELEQAGFELFTGKAACGFCHTATGERPLFTNFTYNNIGVPSNPQNPALLADPSFRDPGLGGFLQTRPEWADLAGENLGKQKTPTVRNVDKRPFAGATKAFMHNGYFKTLEGVVHFYNTRDVKPACADPLTPEAEALAQDCWPAPEVAANVNPFIGDLGLTVQEEAAIVAFLKTLSDGS